MESSKKNYTRLMVWCLVFLFSAVVNAASDPAIIEAAKKEAQLTLWTSSDLRTASRLVERFEQKYPFLKVKIFRTGTGALHNKIITEALAGQQNWDVMNSQMFTRDLIKRKLLARYKSPEGDKLLDASFRDEAGHWTAIYAVPFVLGYNTNLVKPAEVPKTYEELLSGRWKGGNISIDQDGYELLQGLVLGWGKEKATGFLKKLAAQNPTPRRGNSLRVQLVIAGEYPLLITMASPVELARRDGAPVQWVPLEPVPVGFHAIALAERAVHPNAGKLYIDFVLSREGQEALRSVQRIPVRQDVEADPPNLIKGYARVMLRPMEKEEFDEIIELYKQIFNLR